MKITEMKFVHTNHDAIINPISSGFFCISGHELDKEVEKKLSSVNEAKRPCYAIAILENGKEAIVCEHGYRRAKIFA